MSRINTNVSSLIAQRVLNQNNQNLTKSLERLSTGFKINRGGDDPAGLIASENLRSQKTAISAALGNAERADQVVNIAEGGLQEINGLLLELQSLVGQSANDAGLSVEEREANQLQVDSILQTIDRIAESTSFQGTKLLNGSFDFTVENQDAAITDFQVNAAKLNPGESRDVQVLVTQSAQQGALLLSFNAEAQLNFGGNADELFVFEVTGSKGAREFSFGSGTALTDIAATINSFKEVTGVSAAVSGANNITLRSVAFGDDEFVSVNISDDAGGNQTGGINNVNATDVNTVGTLETSFAAANGAVRDDGQDVGAIINGINATADGLKARVSSEFLDVEVTLSDSAGTTNAITPGAITTAFTITGGGAKFNLGPNVDISNQVSIGLQNVAARNLGNAANGFLNSLGSGQANNLVDGNLTDAQKVVNDVIKQVSSLRGRVGAFQKNVVGATIRSLNVAFENTSAAESAIRDTDFAQETANLTRNQILVQAASSALATANSNPQNVLSLL